MNKEKALKNQGLEFREDIVIQGGERRSLDTSMNFCAIIEVGLQNYK